MEVSQKNGGEGEYQTDNKNKEGWLDWVHLAWEMGCKTRY